MGGEQGRGSTVRDNRTIGDPREEEQLTRSLILKNATDAQLRLVLGICDRYGFDPLLKHVVIVGNNLYVTRDGLLHLAHQSGQFDGIEVEMQVLPSGEWAATCTVYRKDMGRPIRYTAFESEHKPSNPGGSAWGKYPRAMLQKCAEVMALRRAFDVSVGAAEEIGYDGITPQTNAGRVTVVEAAPAQLAAPPPLPAQPLGPEEFAAFLDGFLALAEEGHSRGALIAAMAAQAPALDQAQRDELKAHFAAIMAERRATRGLAAPPDALTRAIIAAEVVTPTAAALAASADPFADGAPAGVAG